MKESEFQKLIRKYQEDCINDKDREVLDQWLAHLQEQKPEVKWGQSEINSLKNRLEEGMIEDKPKSNMVKILKIAIPAIAAACLLIFGLFYFQKGLQVEQVVAIQPESIYPSSEQATITLENGKVITLNNSDSNLLSRNGELFHSDGKALLDKDLEALKNQKVVLHTPKGKQLAIVLDDGTKVWLNANSSLTYPLMFDAKERIVNLEGEAYFEVAHQVISSPNSAPQRKPFIVHSNQQKIEVLGTKFNVKGYANEPEIKTALLSGKVKVHTQTNNQFLLKPNQESILNKSNQQVKINEVDAMESISWKNNLFSFQNADLKEILTEIQRWYDIEVDIAKWPTDRFYGQVARNEPLSEVIQMIEKSSKLRFHMTQKGDEKRLSLKY